MTARLALRLARGGQTYILPPPGTPYPVPFAIPHAIAQRSGEKPGRVGRKPQGGKSTAQLPDEGHGPLFYRRYRLTFTAPGLTAADLMTKIQGNPDKFCAQSLAHYHKTKGKLGELHVGDEFFITLTGPFNAPVRVAQVSERAFTLVTLQDHMEAGEIHFETRSFVDASSGEEHVEMQIVSWARSRDRLVDFAYDTLKVAQAIQNEMWTSFLEIVARKAGGRKLGPVEILIQRIPEHRRRRVSVH